MIRVMSQAIDLEIEEVLVVGRLFVLNGEWLAGWIINGESLETRTSRYIDLAILEFPAIETRRLHKEFYFLA